jgi:hypothetical protein
MIAACSPRDAGESDEKLKRRCRVFASFSVLDWVCAHFSLVGAS